MRTMPARTATLVRVGRAAPTMTQSSVIVGHLDDKCGWSRNAVAGLSCEWVAAAVS